MPVTRLVCLHPARCPETGAPCSRTVSRGAGPEAPPCARFAALPQGPSLRRRFCCPAPSTLGGPIRPTRGHAAISQSYWLYATPSLCGSASATREWFRAFAARSLPTCRPHRPRGADRLHAPSSFTGHTGLRPLAKGSALPSDPPSASRGAALSGLSWFASLRPAGLLASQGGSNQTLAWLPETCTPGLPASWSPFSPPGMTTVATGQFPPAGLAPAGTSASIAAPPTPQMGLFQRPVRRLSPRPGARGTAARWPAPGRGRGC